MKIIVIIIIFFSLWFIFKPKAYYGNFHTHTNYSLEEGEGTRGLGYQTGYLSSYDEIINEAARIGLDFVVMTNYDLIQEETKKKCPNEKRVLCILGEEINPSDYRHIVAVDINRTIEPILTPQQTINEIHNQGGIAILAHPYNEQAILDGSTLGVDAVECFNMRNNMLHIDNITKIAKKLNLPCVYVSDSHFAEDLNKAYSKCYMKKLTKENIIEAVKTGKCKPVINTKIFEPANYSNFYNTYATIKGCIPKQCLKMVKLKSSNIDVVIDLSKLTVRFNRTYGFVVTEDYPICDNDKDFSDNYTTIQSIGNKNEFIITDSELKQELIRNLESMNVIFEVTQTCSLSLINISKIK